MPISLILTPFDHFHFRPTSGLLSSQDLTYCHIAEDDEASNDTESSRAREYQMDRMDSFHSQAAGLAYRGVALVGG